MKSRSCARAWLRFLPEDAVYQLQFGRVPRLGWFAAVCMVTASIWICLFHFPGAVQNERIKHTYAFRPLRER